MDNNKLNFITTYLRHRSVYTAYCIAYDVEDQRQYEKIMAAGQQLMDDPEVGGLIRSVLEHVHYEVQQEIRAEQKQELLTVQRKRELLARIATGEISVMQHYKGKDCNQCTQMVQPTINQMIRAIDLDSKLAGHYPVKQSADNRQFTAPVLEPIETSAVVPPFREDRRVPRAETEIIISESQQHSEAVSLRPLKEASISQQHSEAVSLRPLKEPSFSQQHSEAVSLRPLKEPSFSQQHSEAVSLRPLNETSISQQHSEAVSLRPLKEASISQQHSEAVSLRPLKEPSFSQQHSEAVSLRPLNETLISQHNATTIMSPAGGGVRRTGVEGSRGTDNNDYCNKTQQLCNIPLLTKEGGMTNSE